MVVARILTRHAVKQAAPVLAQIVSHGCASFHPVFIIACNVDMACFYLGHGLFYPSRRIVILPHILINRR